MAQAFLVDDEEDICLMVSKILGKVGIQTQCANRVEDAFQCLEETSYDYYFFDLHLPDGTGFELIEKVRKLNPEAHLMVISAYDGQSELDRAEALGIHSFIKKPFTKKQVLAAVDRTL